MMDARGTLWCTAELGEAVLAIDQGAGTFASIPIDGAPHWIAISGEQALCLVQDA
jgi:hypothetical protein